MPRRDYTNTQRSESTQAACAHLRGGSLRSSGGSCTPWCSGPAGPGSWGGPPSSSTPERSGCPACSARRPGKTTVSLSCVSPSVRTPPCCATWSRRVAQRVPVFILLVHLGHLMVCVLRYHRHHVPPGLCAPRGQVRYGLSHEPPFLTCDKRLEFPQALLERFQGQLRSLSSFLSERSASRPGPRPPPSLYLLLVEGGLGFCGRALVAVIIRLGFASETKSRNRILPRSLTHCAPRLSRGSSRNWAIWTCIW